MAKEQMTIEISLNRRFNLGNFNHKEYTIKVSGTEELIEKQLEEKKEKLNTYITTLENLIEAAHEANMNKDKIEKAQEKKEEAKA
jgi:hypothetical protein